MSNADWLESAPQALMAAVDSIDAFSLLQNMAPMSYDSSRLVDVACIAYAHVDAAHVKELRAQFFATVEKQFQVGAGFCTAGCGMPDTCAALSCSTEHCCCVIVKSSSGQCPACTGSAGQGPA